MCDVEDQPCFNNPGPGSYSPTIKGTTLRSGSPSFTMKSRIPDQGISNRDPGPGAYTLPSNFGKHKGSALAGRTKDLSLKTDSPGPAAYSPHKINYGKNITFAGRTNLLSLKKDVPSPCDYNPYQHFGSSKPKISMASRTTTGNQDSGPGFVYDPQLPKTTHSISFAGRTTIPGEQNNNPGPGAYQMQPFATHSPKFSMASRCVDIASKPNNDVGPGAYESPDRGYKYCHDRQGKITLAGRNKDLVENQNIPGPGAYQMPSNFAVGNHKGATLSGRTQIKSTSEIPGPGAYSPMRRNATASPSFSGRTIKPGAYDWDIRHQMDSPAPGDYDVVRKQKGKQISMAGRTETEGKNDVPGPGTYNEFKGFSSKIAVSLSGRTDVRNLQPDSVGPGTYTLPSTFNTHTGISISGRPKKRGGVITE